MSRQPGFLLPVDAVIVIWFRLVVRMGVKQLRQVTNACLPSPPRPARGTGAPVVPLPDDIAEGPPRYTDVKARRSPGCLRNSLTLSKVRQWRVYARASHKRAHPHTEPLLYASQSVCVALSLTRARATTLSIYSETQAARRQTSWVSMHSNPASTPSRKKRARVFVPLAVLGGGGVRVGSARTPG